MIRCIYTGADNSTESFSSDEHIFPKCIGGVHTLPKGWVCDSVNSSFSASELIFARNNPTVTLSRMFFSKTGRKKHKNRDLIGVLKNTEDSDDYSLGYIVDGTPRSINQLCINSEIPMVVGKPIPIKVITSKTSKEIIKSIIREFWKQLQLFDGTVCVIKSNDMPSDMVLLGCKDSRWYLGLSKTQNEYIATESIGALVSKIITNCSVEEMLEKSQIGESSHQVQTQFSIHSNITDILKVYAKIAVNCLAKLKGYEYVMGDAFNEIKHAILTGDNIQNYVFFQNGTNSLKGVLSKFENNLTLGSRFHSAVLFYNSGTLYCEIALYGIDSLVLVKLGKVSAFTDIDFYICDWENKQEYTMLEYVNKVCSHIETE